MDMDFFEDYYNTLLGLLVEEARVPGVENAFAPGSVCQAAYENMRAAGRRICQRLGVEEDPDLEGVVSSMETIQKELCRRIFLSLGGRNAKRRMQNAEGSCHPDESEGPWRDLCTDRPPLP